MPSQSSLQFTQEVPVRHEVDVCIVGGGPAGIAAAVVAARQGASVFLGEALSCLGGLGTAGLVPVFMQYGDGENFVADGFGRQLLTTLQDAGGTCPGNFADDGYWAVAYKNEVLKRVYDDIVTHAGVEVLFHSQLIGVQKEGDRVTAAVFAGKSELFAVRATVFIDCSGDGDLCVRAGAPFEKGDSDQPLMPASLCSMWAGIDFDRREIYPDGERLQQAIDDGVFTYEDYHLTGMFRVGETVGGGNIGHIFGIDATDERSMTRAYMWGRKSMLEYERYYKEYLKGFEKMELVATAPLLGVRETRRIMGDYVLCLDDYEKRAIFADEIGRYCFPVDIHPREPGAEEMERHKDFFYKKYRYDKGENYGIPYRCLTPRELSNVLVAGRCVSTDRYVQGSLRVMPGCFIMGQVAGMAAALARETAGDVRRISVPQLQQNLKSMNAYLPNA